MAKLNAYGPSLIVLGTAAMLLVAGPSVVRHLTFHQTTARIQMAGQRLESSPMLQQLNQAYRDLATFVEPSVVHISTERVFRDRRGESQRRPAAGSGWIYDAEGQYVPEAFERIFARFDSNGSGALNEVEIAAMIEAHSKERAGGKTASKLEFGLLLDIAADRKEIVDGKEVRAISRGRMESFYDGSLFYVLAGETPPWASPPAE